MLRPLQSSSSSEEDDDSYDDDDVTASLDHYSTPNSSLPDVKGWDIFRDVPPEADRSAGEGGVLIVRAMKFTKLLLCGTTFLLVLGGGVIAKGSMLFMTSQLRRDTTVTVCNRMLDIDRQKRYEAQLPEEARVTWVWVLLFSLLAPEVGSLLRALRICFFKTWRRAPVPDLLLVLFMETCHTVGVALLAFSVLPDLDVLKAAMITNCVCLLPALLSLLSDVTREVEDSDKTREWQIWLRVLLGALALLGQATGTFVWPLVEEPYSDSLWIIPPAVLLTSCGWWENYVPKKSPIGFIRALERVKVRLEKTRYHTYIFASIWKMVCLFVSMLVIWHVRGESVENLFEKGFTSHAVNVTEVRVTSVEPPQPSVEVLQMEAWFATPMWLLLIQVLGAYVCYVTGKYACRIMIQEFSYALPVTLTMPVTISLLVIFCGVRNDDPCTFEGVIPDYMFFRLPPLHFLDYFLGIQHAWIWLVWLASQVWVTLHIWWPRCERLASTERIFVTPMYNALLVDQSLALNRRIDDKPEKLAEVREPPAPEDVEDQCDYVELRPGRSSHLLEYLGREQAMDSTTRIFACATMWHETKEEMVEMLKSIFRMDEDQSARKFAKEYFSDPNDPEKDYYEFETNIFFDDAFVSKTANQADAGQVNSYVRDMLHTMDEAASHVHETQVRLRPPKIISTPYGGQLMWILPGKTRLIVHLKDSARIRHKKRWSQVMYMYYLLGHRLMELEIPAERKEVIAQNTFLLALDGDIDFQPQAVQLLVDLMKKDKHLGAACGRIHPIGQGAMVWYQRFEYAVGHWLQKATEHMIGCVLCSPGCFSLFRGKALMDDNVMKKYTKVSEEARHYVQYDQGEDRWLCTLLLQQGYRVEYSAASDAYTHCPEGFGEFYNQRRRWVPSTMANILDLLGDYKRTVRINNNISMLYIAYQVLLLGGSVLGPGTILLMLVGAFNTALGLSLGTAMIVNIVPIIFFMIICYFTKGSTQIAIAGIISAVYGMVMIAVLIGIMVQITEDGPFAPSSLFFFIVALQMIVTAFMHPREFGCLPFGVVYYITVPSMYMLLIIYSLFNLNDVSWGTREVAAPVEQKKMTKEEEELARLVAAGGPKKKQGAIMEFLQGLRSKASGGDEDEGTLEFSLAGIFRCMCCTYPRVIDEKQQLLRIADTLEILNRRMEGIERTMEPKSHQLGRARSFRRVRTDTGPSLGSLVEEAEVPEPLGSISSDGEEDSSSTLPVPHIEEKLVIGNKHWMKDSNLKKCPVEFLTSDEKTFWKELIKAYLKPLEKNKQKEETISQELRALRNKTVFAFFMINAMFVMTLYLIQDNKDVLHFNWPLGVDNLIEFRNKEIIITKEYLELEPIGMLFLISFAVILVIQFIAMLFHRFGTFSHIMATTEFSWRCTKRVDEVSGDANLSKHGVEYARELQRLRGNEDDDSDKGSVQGAKKRRFTIVDLEKRSHKPSHGASLADAFERNFLSVSGQGAADGLPSTVPKALRRTMRRDTLQALALRRTSVLERRQSQLEHRRSMSASQEHGGISRPSTFADSELQDDFVPLPPSSPMRRSSASRPVNNRVSFQQMD